MLNALRTQGTRGLLDTQSQVRVFLCNRERRRRRSIFTPLAYHVFSVQQRHSSKLKLMLAWINGKIKVNLFPMFDQYKILGIINTIHFITVVLYFLLTETNQLIVMRGIMPVRDSRWWCRPIVRRQGQWRWSQ